MQIIRFKGINQHNLAENSYLLKINIEDII